MVAMFSGSMPFVRGVLISAVFALVIAIFALFKKKLSMKIKRMLWGSFVIVLALPSTIHFLRVAYEESIPRVSENDYNL
ncbi:MAG: hypothetical protein LBH96_00185, partial [Candidatus Peribacteria bacterium]|nr:hypothetical protein [Candidatus Peribacteria bacterium]